MAGTSDAKQRAVALRAHGLRAPPDDQADLAHSGATTTTAGAAHDETIHTTANHPWLTTDRGWVVAGDLHVGEPVRTLDGQVATVAWVHTVPGQADYYNLTVADDHTYAVGDGQYVVHNCSAGSGGASVPSGEYVADSGVFFDRMDTPAQAAARDAILADSGVTLYVPDAAAGEVNVTDPVHGRSQAANLAGRPGGATIIRIPNADLGGVNPAALAQSGNLGSNDTAILETARQRGLPVLTTNYRMSYQIASNPVLHAQWGGVPIIPIPR